MLLLWSTHVTFSYLPMTLCSYLFLILLSFPIVV